MNGVSYFQTAEKRGIFLRPEKLEIETLNQPTSPAPASPTQRADSERSVNIYVKKIKSQLYILFQPYSIH